VLYKMIFSINLNLFWTKSLFLYQAWYWLSWYKKQMIILRKNLVKVRHRKEKKIDGLRFHISLDIKSRRDLLSTQISLYLAVGNCNIDFLNFCHPQVQNFEISNLYKRNWNFGVIFRKYRKQNWKSTKYFATSWKPSVIPLKFCEMFCEILLTIVKFHNFLLNSVKVWEI